MSHNALSCCDQGKEPLIFLRDPSSSRHLTSNLNIQSVRLFNVVDSVVVVCVTFETLDVVMLQNDLRESEGD